MIWLVLPSTGSGKFMDFDELDPVYDDRYACWCDNPLSDEYADWGGLLIHNSWVVGTNQIIAC